MFRPLISANVRSTDRRSASWKSMLIGLPVYCLPPLPGTGSDAVGCAAACFDVGGTGGGGCCAVWAACARPPFACAGAATVCAFFAAGGGGFGAPVFGAAGGASAGACTVFNAVIGSGGVI